MKHNQTIYKTILRESFLMTLIVAFSFMGVHAQTCDKTANKEQGKCMSEKMNNLVWNGEFDKIKALVDENNELVNQRLKSNETMLTQAAWKGDYAIVEYLVSKKADVNCKNDWNNTALHNASTKGFNDIITLLLSNGANVNEKGNNGDSPLMLAVSNNHLETVKLLFKAGSNINAVNDYNQAAFIQASWSGNADIIGFLAENGADINLATSDGFTPLHFLAGNGKLEAIQILLKRGADVNKINSEGQTPLHYALINNKPEAANLLINKTQNINLPEKNLGNTPLHIAAINGDLKSTELLLNAGAKADIKNNSQKTPVDYAAKYGYSDLVNYYVSKSLASKDMLEAARENQSSGLVKVNNGEAKVIYTGHSGWAVQTEKHVLIFDYSNMNKYETGGLANGLVCAKELKDKDVIVFVSHDHGDHFDTCIYQWAKDVKNITYVYGFKPEESWANRETGYQGPKYVYINNNQTQQVDNTTVTTQLSNDTGQGFLVVADGVTIYHPGDHALFTAEDEAGFKKEVDFIASQTKSVDIAFLPVSGCPSRWKKEFIVQGFFYTIDKLNPVNVFPMHAFQQEYTTKEFAELAEKRMIKNQIVCVENTGDSFSYPKTMVASK